jgi:hypothetical protein
MLGQESADCCLEAVSAGKVSEKIKEVALTYALFANQICVLCLKQFSVIQYCLIFALNMYNWWMVGDVNRHLI